MITFLIPLAVQHYNKLHKSSQNHNYTTPAAKSPSEKNNTSFFKQCFLDLLEGRDREPVPDGFITGEELGLYLKTKVPQYNKSQHPQYGKIPDPRLDKGDFVFELGRTGTTTSIGIPDDSALDKIEEEARRRETFLKAAKEAYEIAAKIGKPVAVKAQVWVGGRGKAGAIKLADTPEEAEKVAGVILGMEVKGFPVRKVLVEEKLDIEKEYYVGVIPDSSWMSRCPVVMFSPEGGMDIEQVPEEKIFRAKVDYLKGFPIYEAIDLAVSAGVPKEQLRDMSAVISRVVEAFKKKDCNILEIKLSISIIIITRCSYSSS